MRSGKQVPPRGPTANQQANVIKKATWDTNHNKVMRKIDNHIPYNIMTHLKKIPSLLSIYDTLHMSPELRDSLVHALTHLEEFAHNDEIARAYWKIAIREGLCMPMVSFEDTNQYWDHPHHNRPLFIIRSIDD